MTVVPLDLGALDDALRRDPEFVLHSRYLTATLRVVIEELQSFRIVVRAGQIAEIDSMVTPFRLLRHSVGRDQGAVATPPRADPTGVLPGLLPGDVAPRLPHRGGHGDDHGVLPGAGSLRRRASSASRGAQMCAEPAMPCTSTTRSPLMGPCAGAESQKAI